MTPEQLDLIPDHLLAPIRNGGCRPLIDWLHARGWQMTLLELETQRTKRGTR